jgi:hypothetical protein
MLEVELEREGSLELFSLVYLMMIDKNIDNLLENMVGLMIYSKHKTKDFLQQT